MSLREVSQFYHGSTDLNDLSGTLNCIRALGGYTEGKIAATAFDTDTFKESEYVAQVAATAGNAELALNWFVTLVSICHLYLC